MTDTDIARDETASLIASNKVEGTAVYNHNEERLGTIHNFMVDKRTGQVEYAVLSFGGFLGIGDNHYPIPWEVLRYSEDAGGYVVDLDKGILEGAPHYAAGQDPSYDRDYGRSVYGHYGLDYTY
jgi:sporulation protein YlmC with PRC-barrel domain